MNIQCESRANKILDKKKKKGDIESDMTGAVNSLFFLSPWLFRPNINDSWR